MDDTLNDRWAYLALMGAVMNKTDACIYLGCARLRWVKTGKYWLVENAALPVTVSRSESRESSNMHLSKLDWNSVHLLVEANEPHVVSKMTYLMRHDCKPLYNRHASPFARTYGIYHPGRQMLITFAYSSAGLYTVSEVKHCLLTLDSSIGEVCLVMRRILDDISWDTLYKFTGDR